MNSNKAKLETSRRLSLAIFNVGKPLLAPTPMASNVTHRVTFGPTTTAPNPTAANATAIPTAAMTTPTATMTTIPVTTSVAAGITIYVTSRAMEFDKGG